MRATVPQRLVVLAATAAAFIGLIAFGIWLTAAKGLSTDARVAASKIMRHAGIPMRTVWANPVTGKVVELPHGWYVQSATHRPGLGELTTEFECEAGPDKCRVVLGGITNSTVGFLDPEFDTTPNSIEYSFNHLIGEPDATVLDSRDTLVGPARLDQIYVASLPASAKGGLALRTGLAWFSQKRHAWVLVLSATPAADDERLVEARRSLALSLVQSTRTADGR